MVLQKFSLKRLVVISLFSTISSTAGFAQSAPRALTTAEVAFMNTYSASFCGLYIPLYQQLADQYKRLIPSYASSLLFYANLYKGYCGVADQLRALDKSYKDYLANLAKPKAVLPTPAPDESDRLFGKLDSKGPNDAYFSTQSSAGMNNISMLNAWAVTRDCNNVPIWVFDTGGPVKHSDVQVDAKRSYNYISPNSSWNDDNGHGTHVIGIIGATANNRSGIAGVCWRSNIAAEKVLGPKGTGTSSDILRALNNVSNSLPDSNRGGVYNLSVSVMNSVAFSEQASSTASKPFSDAFRLAEKKGIIVAVAAGNDGKVLGLNSMWNGLSKNIFVVGASDAAGRIASFSNRGGLVNVYVPGVSIPSTYLNDSYVSMSGTSMASPMMAGIAALYWNINPNKKPSEVVSSVLSSADKLKDAQTGEYLRVNAEKLMKTK